MQTGFGTYFFDTRPIEFKVAQDDIKAFLSTAVSFFTPPYFFYLQSKKDAKRYLNQLPRRKQRGFRYAVSLTHNDAMAEDIVQDACMRIIQAKKEWNRGLFLQLFETGSSTCTVIQKNWISIPLTGQKRIQEHQTGG